ncbi:MAG: RNA 2',3'-cyclic phosphodiesterase [Candidatus Omnitrophica bacterium]|nr:RNA 2',3'-cyclic phosphodiesterase [Candidatus Omnitrophota bacterium]
MTIRCFLAFSLNGQFQERLKHTLDELRQTNADVKWVKLDNIHLTLKFLGELEVIHINNIKSRLKERCSGLSPITSYLNGIGAFPDLSHPKIVWAALDDSKNEIRKLVEILKEELIIFGVVREDHPFKPHITLGRVRTSVNLKDLIQTIEKITIEEHIQQTFDKIILYKSQLTSQGPIYEVLQEFYLGRKELEVDRF